MTITFEATYENGVIKPDKPIDLADGARVTVTVMPKVTRAAIEPAVDDPFDAVIGIGQSGSPYLSPADEHDRIIYGRK